MKFDITSFQAVAANLAVEGEVCDLAYAKLSTPTETDPEIAPLIEKVGATSIAEIDRLIAELQDARNYLISEGERIERETVRYANLTLMASATTKIISDAVSQWHPASDQQNASEVTATSTEDDITRKLAMLIEGECDALGPRQAAETFGFSKSRYYQTPLRKGR